MKNNEVMVGKHKSGIGYIRINKIGQGVKKVIKKEPPSSKKNIIQKQNLITLWLKNDHNKMTNIPLAGTAGRPRTADQGPSETAREGDHPEADQGPRQTTLEPEARLARDLAGETAVEPETTQTRDLAGPEGQGKAGDEAGQRETMDWQECETKGTPTPDIPMDIDMKEELNTMINNTNEKQKGERYVNNAPNEAGSRDRKRKNKKNHKRTQNLREIKIENPREETIKSQQNPQGKEKKIYKIEQYNTRTMTENKSDQDKEKERTEPHATKEEKEATNRTRRSSKKKTRLAPLT